MHRLTMFIHGSMRCDERRVAIQIAIHMYPVPWPKGKHEEREGRWEGAIIHGGRGFLHYVCSWHIIDQVIINVG